MNLGSWKINDYLTFTANTHTPSTGAATDADAVPSYRIYEDETASPIVTGDMAKLDDAGTIGFYSEQVQLTAAAGFEKGKSYNIYVYAAVGGVTGTLSHTFQMEAEVDANTVSDTNTIADAILTRDWTAVAGEAARSVLNALRFLRNKWSISGSTLTVTKEDDSTQAWTGTVTTDAEADPITANDPS